MSYSPRAKDCIVLMGRLKNKQTPRSHGSTGEGHRRGLWGQAGFLERQDGTVMESEG